MNRRIASDADLGRVINHVVLTGGSNRESRRWRKRNHNKGAMITEKLRAFKSTPASIASSADPINVAIEDLLQGQRPAPIRKDLL